MSDSELQNTRRINAICEHFEASWRAGQRPQIEAVVAAADIHDRTLLLAELIALEVELRLEAGEAAPLDEYRKRFGADAEAVAQAESRIASVDAYDAARSPRERFEATVQAQRLELGESLGAGGMGVVVRAKDHWLKRNLAVKILSDRWQTRRQAVERFLREARICARLQHPGIVPVYEMGWMGERPYFAMKVATGRSLAEWLVARSHVTDELPRWLEVFERVCETVAYAHDQGVVHRDLKPANVMLGSFGEVYVIDWGLAKWLPGEPPPPDRAAEGEATVDDDLLREDPDAVVEPLPLAGEAAGFTGSLLGVVVGTPAYMSPEQAKGIMESLDRRSDVFALGAMLCEILTGAPPYADGDHLTQLERARQGDLAEALGRLAACAADRVLVDLARDCLASEPENRPPDAGHVLQRLSAYLGGVQEKLRHLELERAEAQVRAQEQRRRRRVVGSLAAGLCLLALALGAGTVWFAWTESARQSRQARQLEQLNADLAQTLDEVEQLYAEAPRDWRNDPSRRTRIRELARRAETLAETQGAEPAHVQHVHDLRDRIAAEEADGRLLDRLEAIRLKSAEVNPKTNKFATGRTRPLYRQAFDEYGLNVETVDARQAAAKIRSRPGHVVEACVFGLESWRSLFKSGVVPQSQWLDAVLDEIDDSPWRRAVRQACRQQDWSAANKLLDAVQHESLSADAVELAAKLLIEANQMELALRLLKVAQPRHPGDFWINQYLGLAYFALPDPRYEEAVRFLTAALAIRETDAAYFNLASALMELERYAEAEQALRSALRIAPDYVQAHLQLADVLDRQGQTAEAKTLRERAAQLQ